MTLLWVNLIVVFTFAFFARYAATPSINIPAQIKPNKVLIFGALLSLIVTSGFRSGVGDTGAYKHIYVINDFTWEFIKSQNDIGFGILQMVLKKYVSEDPQILIFTTALITNLLVVSVLYNYSRMIELSLYVYITGGLFLVSMNGIRQALAAAIVFTATKFLIDGNFKMYFLIVIFASFFHQTALILLPFYFLARLKAWSKATVALIAFAVIIVIGFDMFSTFLFSVIANTQYGVYKDFDEGGANILRVAVAAVPIAVAYLGRSKLRKVFPESDYIVNMALLGFIVMIIATQNWVFARFSIYFGLYQLILISWIVKIFKERDQSLIYYGIIICYFGYYYYENVITLNIIYRNTFLIGG
ncbi:EpsG family protein [Aquibacillus halophilus]|uniref:EpsG family protein n=1 Tax=Aquibacillus halophilus TaxID=930132 RepID=A0A6A8DBK9_9BACI|nr:EpsG family protein [Aquibacillus halophilus]MRH42690.1 EpsG family protein [Aquibacillus halophilus]